MDPSFNQSSVREVMDIPQLAVYLGISQDTAYRYALEGKLPAFRLGNRWRFKRSLVDAWIEKMSIAEMEASQL